MTNIQNPLNKIIESQVAWADRHGVPYDDSNMCRTVDDNIFMSLDPDTAAEFGEGAGSELGTSDAPGSMASLRSSSALAVNVFDPWRGRNLAPLASLFAANRFSNRIRFEVQFPTSLRGIPPHLDVVIDEEGHIPLAIESKYTEIYSPAHNDFRDSYFERPGLWDGFGYVHELEMGIAEGSVQFEHLGAAQLIKHALGLQHAYGPMGFRLLYLYYVWPSEIAEAHSEEVDRFAEIAQMDLEFAPMTYQKLFDRLKTVEEHRPGYMSYLGDRYFSSVVDAGRPDHQTTSSLRKPETMRGRAPSMPSSRSRVAARRWCVQRDLAIRRERW